MHNGSVLGNGTVRNVDVGLGANWALVDAIWDPKGKNATDIGLKLLGQYVSGEQIPLEHVSSLNHIICDSSLVGYRTHAN